MILKTLNLSKKYGKNLVLDKIDLNIPENSIYCLVGANGAGKTTVLDILSTLKSPSSGTAIICGKDLSSQQMKIKECIGVFPQDAELYSEQTVSDNMIYLSELKGLDHEKAIIETERILEIVGLQTKSKALVSKLSNGMRKLLGISQTLIKSPRLLILDEPLEGLDPNIIVKIKKLFRTLKNHTTILFSSHNMAQVEEIATHIGILNKGIITLESRLEKLTDKKDEIELILSRPNKSLIPYLKKLKAVSSLEHEGLAIQIKVKTNNALLDIVKLLIKKKIKLQKIRTGQSLERAFVEVTR